MKKWMVWIAFLLALFCVITLLDDSMRCQRDNIERTVLDAGENGKQELPSAAPAIKDGQWDVTQLVKIKVENFPEAPEGVYMTVKSVEDGKVTATMHNDTAEEWDYDKASYALQVKLDDVWYTIPERDNSGWPMVAIRTWMNPGDKVENVYGLGWWGELPAGTYRVVQMVYQGTVVENNVSRRYLMAEFDLP